MFNKQIYTGLLCTGLLLTLPVLAEDTKPWLDVAVPEITYNSPLISYQSYSPQSSGNWREANDTVGRIGGWQAYAAEVWEASQNSGDDQPAKEIPPQHHNH